MREYKIIFSMLLKIVLQTFIKYLTKFSKIISQMENVLSF